MNCGAFFFPNAARVQRVFIPELYASACGAVFIARQLGRTVLDVILHHEPFLSLTGIVFGMLGTLLSFNLYASLRKSKGPRKIHWLLITSIISAGAVWTMNFLLQIAHFGGITDDFNTLSLVTSATFIITARFVAFYLSHENKSRARLLLGRTILAFSFSMLPFLVARSFNSTAHINFEVLAVIIFGTVLVYGVIARISSPIRSGPSQSHVVRYSAAFAILSLVLHIATLSMIELNQDHSLGHQVLNVPSAELIAPIVFVMIILSIVGSSTIYVDRASTADAVERYRQLAMHDSLTGLRNRLSMQLTIDNRIHQNNESPAPFAVAVVDLDRFKDVNDVHGHAAGDALLKGLAQHITEELRDGETLYRTGGDEFVAVKYGVSDPAVATQFGRFLCDLVYDFDSWMTGNVRVGASVGICLFPQDGDTTGDLLSRADLAMYRAKALGRNQVSAFDQTMDEARRAKKALSMDLRLAIDENQLEIYWQPQVESKSGQLVGFEALLRWEHSTRGSVSPGEFIPLAEQTGQIVDIGRWVLQKACEEAATWKRPFRIAVNVAAGQLNQSDLPTLVQNVLKETGLPPSRLELEITETGIIQDKDKAFATVSAIKALGVSIAMDDFGTGYSSLSTLQTFPFDKLKIDRAFIAAMGHTQSADVIVEATIQIAHAMGLKVLAEGVETIEQVKQLQSISCHEMQGYFYCKPLPIEQAKAQFRLMASTLDEFDADTAQETLPPHRRKSTG